ncbi:MAG: hypothetical protein WCH30_08080 [Chlorobiaceae bacterium]
MVFEARISVPSYFEQPEEIIVSQGDEAIYDHGTMKRFDYF